MRLSQTLATEALADYRRELLRSLSVFGVVSAKKMQSRLLAAFRHIAAGTASGHRHQLLASTPAAFRCVTVFPLLIVFNADRRVVIAIIDGRRDIAAIVARRLGAPRSTRSHHPTRGALSPARTATRSRFAGGDNGQT